MDHSKAGQPQNTSLLPSGSTEVTSRLHRAITVMSRNILRHCFTVVSCQLARLRLLLTAQTIKAALDGGGRKATEVRAVQSAKAYSPTFVRE